VRIYDADALRDWRDFADVGIQAGFGDPLLRMGSLKGFADGSLGSETGWMTAPYADDPRNHGLASGDLRDPVAMYRFIQGADKAGLQVSIHAIGDRAIHEVLDLMKRAEKENGPADRRFRIEHLQHLGREDVARLAPLGVIASMQPYHAIDDGRFAEKRASAPSACKSATLGEGYSTAVWSLPSARTGRSLPWIRSWESTPPRPVARSTVVIQTAGCPHSASRWPRRSTRIPSGRRPLPEQREAFKGSLERGKLADLVVLSGDIFAHSSNVPPKPGARERQRKCVNS
jgi:hypothetical protein